MVWVPGNGQVPFQAEGVWSEEDSEEETSKDGGEVEEKSKDGAGRRRRLAFTQVHVHVLVICVRLYCWVGFGPEVMRLVVVVMSLALGFRVAGFRVLAGFREVAGFREMSGFRELAGFREMACFRELACIRVVSRAWWRSGQMDGI